MCIADQNSKIVKGFAVTCMNMLSMYEFDPAKAVDQWYTTSVPKVEDVHGHKKPNQKKWK
jgi:hypothetical protein